MADEDVLNQEETQGDEDGGQEAAEPSLQDKLKEAVDVRVEDVATLRKKLTITVPRETISTQFDEQYDELRREALVPGFRKGRAPRRLLEKRFGTEVGETLVSQFLSSGYMAATEKIDLKALGDPLIWAKEKGADTETLMDVSKAADLMEVPKEGPFVFSCEVEVQPEFDLPELDGIPVEKPVVTITDEKLDAQMNQLRGIQGTYTPVGEGPVEVDDVLTADLKMTCGETVLKEEQNVRLAARPQVVDSVVLQNLGEVLVGAKPGDTRKASGPIPDTYFKAEFRGQQADLTITVRQIQRMQLPEMNDEFAKRFGFNTVSELRNWVKTDMESRQDEEIGKLMADQVCQYLLDKTSFDLPERLSERQIHHVTMRRKIELYQQGMPPAEVEKAVDELETRTRKDAVTGMKLAFIFAKLAEQFEVEVDEAEVNAQIAAIARRQGRRFDRVRDELIKQNVIDNLFTRIRDDKIVAKLVEKATVTEVQPQGKTEDESADKNKKEKSGARKEAAPAEEPLAEGEVQPAKPKRSPPRKKSKASDDADAT
ncbi:MAG TPA: trigger factor [Phycisphaerae bacterium]|nr:trigger factor [Phycisphaerae bacterium]